jgi:MoaA/NifB/PqqE/SkfB family radical SAM enzyme
MIARLTEMLLPAEMVVNLRTGRDWKHWVNSLTLETLEDLTNAPAEIEQKLFKAHVRLVEIETHAKCNRTCSFCPNSIVDRRFNSTLTNTEMLNRVFQELGSIDYTGQIKVARYSEPLAQIDFLCEQIAIARELVPHAQIAIVTNTDYLTPAMLGRLRQVGLDVVYMSIYLKAGEHWTPEIARDYSDKLAKKLGTQITAREQTPVSLRCNYEYEGLDLRSACMNFKTCGTDRGSSLDQYITQQRMSPCREPFETFVIDYTGAVMPCCNLRSDLPNHQAFPVGDLAIPDSSIFAIYAGQLSAWRRSMVGFDPKPFPCATCNHRQLSKGLEITVARQLEKRLDRIGYKKQTIAP